MLRASAQTRASVQRWSSSHPCAAGPSSNAASNDRTCPADRRHSLCGPLDRRASAPPARNAVRQRHTDCRDTRRPLATTATDNPAANIPAASIRTASRRACSTTVNPPPPGYLIPET